MAKPSQQYDVVVIGGGAVGENVAARVVEGGLSAVIVEAALLGGECSYWACMPSKALLRSGHAREAARRVGGAREAVTGPLDSQAVLARRNQFTSNWDDSGQVTWAEGAGVKVMRGRARLTGARAVEVTTPAGQTEHVQARVAVAVCTGSRASLPPIPGLADVTPWTSRDGTSSQEVPESLAVLGAGAVGVELAQAWRRLGSAVTLIESAPFPLPAMEEFVGQLLTDALDAEGIELRCGADVRSVSKADGQVRLELAEGDPVLARRLLVAAGRTPNTDELGVEVAGLEPGKPLAVNDNGHVAGGWLYAAGDVTDQPRLTHQGKYSARVVGDVIVARAKGTDISGAHEWSAYRSTANHHAVPQVVFTDPEIASVGRTAAAARREGYRVRTVDLDLSVAGSALQADGYQGRAFMVVDEERQVLLGVTFVGQDVAELLHTATVAIVGQVPLDRLWHAVPAYPTISEIWLRLLEKYGM